MSDLADFAQAREIRRNAAADRRLASERQQREQAREDREHKAQLRDKASETRRARRAEFGQGCWRVLRDYGLWVPLIAAPAAMAWSAQAEQGIGLYGSIGQLLPVVTESAAWVISFEIARRAGQGVAVGRARVAMWTVAASAAGLVFLHGLKVSGWIAGVVMAVVSVAGLALHQIKIAMDAAAERGEIRQRGLGMRWLWAPWRAACAARRAAVTGRPAIEVFDDRSREDRKLAADADKRMRRIRRAAMRQAKGRVFPDGRVALMYDSVTVELAGSRWFRRAVLQPVESGHDEWVDTVEDWLRNSASSEPQSGSGTGSQLDDQHNSGNLTVLTPGDARSPEPGSKPPQELSAGERAEDARDLSRARRLIEGGELPAQPTVSDIQTKLRIQRQRASRIRRLLNQDNRGQNAA
ncbi:hypothetical protein AB0L88_01425 [Saccharopolyspora shandongensis]|uniref:hypothetical protein n=1 Tax=Saccharopolyspora shandongensis TaxID=418495 RepID=UPI0034472E1A